MSLAKTHDVIVVGLGAHGSASAYHLAKRGASVLGLEAFARGHTLGSSGGLTRVIRLAYFERPDYVPLLVRAWDLWLEVQREAGEELLLACGGVYVGPPDGKTFAGALRSAQEHGLPHEVLDAAALRHRLPVFELEPSWRGLFEEKAGLVWSERAIKAHLRLAEAHGADLQFDERVRSWREDQGGVEVRTDRGTCRAAKLVVAAGAWNSELLPLVAPLIAVERVPLFWFEPTASVELFDPARLPVYLMESGWGQDFYGFPYLPDQGLKVARHHSGVPADPNLIDRVATAADEEQVRAFLRRRMPLGNGPLRSSTVCMYTNTPDLDFLLGAYPGTRRVSYASACSGHGYKFSTVIGEVLADLALHGSTTHPIGFLSLDRFA